MALRRQPRRLGASSGLPRLHSAPMDLHVIGPLASPAERAAVDAVLGPADSGWRGGGARSRDRGPRGARRARRPEPPRPAAAGAPRAPGPGRPDHASRAELRLPAAVRAARRGLRRRHVLRAVRDEAAAAGRRPRLRRHRLPARRRRGRLRATSSGRSGPPARRRATARSAGCAARASALCERAPAAMFTIAGEHAGRARPSRRSTRRASSPASSARRAPRAAARRRRRRRLDGPGRDPRGGPRVRAAGRRAAAPAPPPGRHGRPDVARRLPRAPRLSSPSDQALAMGPEAVIAEVTDVEAPRAAAAPRSRPAASGPPSRRSRRSRTTSSATPTSPSRARSRTACSWSSTRSRSSRR